MRKRPSVLSRFRLAGVAVALGIALIGAFFYTQVNRHFLGAVLGETLGQYADTLAETGFSHPDPAVWQQMAARHGVAILVEVEGADPMAWDETGRPSTADVLAGSQVRAIRIGSDGRRVTFAWTLTSFRTGHLPLIGGLAVMVVAVVGSAFWFLQHQLKPLAWLQGGVEAVAKGDFQTRVPIARNDEIGQVAQAFNEMAGRVGEMIDDRERLLADVSHELRSPIARMKVALEFMPVGDKRDLLERDLREMEKLISVLLERERLRSRAGRLESEKVDLFALAEKVVTAFAGQGPGVQLASSQRPTVQGDRSLLELVVQNLVDNAVKFSQPDSRPILVTVEGGSKTAVLRVADDGSGVPEGREEQIFEPFVKLDPARGHGVGYGLGLNLCQRIVHLHGGTLELRRRKPRGTEAVLRLPN